MIFRTLRLQLAALALSSLCVAYALAQDPTPQPSGQPTPPPAPSPSPKAQGSDPALGGVPYFPLQPGRRWSYRITWTIETLGEESKPPAKRAEHRLDAFVGQPQQIGGKPAALLEWKLDGALSLRSYYRVEEGYLRCLRRLHHQAENVKEFTFEPTQPVLPVAPQVGQEWSWEGKNGVDAGKQSFKALRTESVETGAGTFEALVVQTTYEGEDDKGTLTRWLVREIGIVKEVSEIRTAVAVIRSEGILARFEKGE